MSQNLLRNDGRIDWRPCRDIHRGDVVGVASVATRHTLEGLLMPIPLVDAPTRRAGAGRIAGIDQADGDTGPRRLVFDKASQLMESPRMVPPALCL